VARLAADIARLVAVRAVGHRMLRRAARVALRRFRAHARKVADSAAVVARLGTAAATGVRRSARAAAATAARLASAPAGLLLLDLRNTGKGSGAGNGGSMRLSLPPSAQETARRDVLGEATYAGGLTMSSRLISSMDMVAGKTARRTDRAFPCHAQAPLATAPLGIVSPGAARSIVRP
jgi:hypothetical protein